MNVGKMIDTMVDNEAVKDHLLGEEYKIKDLMDERFIDDIAFRQSMDDVIFDITIDAADQADAGSLSGYAGDLLVDMGIVPGDNSARHAETIRFGGENEREGTYTYSYRYPVSLFEEFGKKFGSFNSSFKDELIRLGSRNPGLREHLRPILDRISSGKPSESEIARAMEKRFDDVSSVEELTSSSSFPVRVKYKGKNVDIRWNGDRLEAETLSGKPVIQGEVQYKGQSARDLARSAEKLFYKNVEPKSSGSGTNTMMFDPMM